MSLIIFWFWCTIFLKLFSVSFAVPSLLHSTTMRAVRSGDAQELDRVIEIQPEFLKVFKVECWAMALKLWSNNPDSADRRRVVMILMNELENKNEQQEGFTPLICAVRYGHRQAVNEIVRVSNANERNSLGLTALMVAVKYGLFEIAEDLLNYGADANICDEKNRSALHYACLLPNIDDRERALWLLLSKNADVSLLNNITSAEDFSDDDLV